LRIAAAPLLEELTDVARVGFHDDSFQGVWLVPLASLLRPRGRLRDLATPAPRWS
jgi:hypothetical protein